VKTKAQLKAKLDEAREEMNRVLDQVGDRWEHQVYSDGLAWNVRQVLVHVADADRGHNRQAMGYAEGQEVVPPDFDVQRYNARTTEKLASKTVEEARADMAKSRQALLEWLDSIDDEKLDREGRHASGNNMTVRNMLRIQAIHEQTHAREIAAALGIGTDG
jgi:hypothetical protein